MSKTEKWWTEIGWQILNSKLINYVGLAIGTIPISNLEFVPAWADLQELAYLISDDGCRANYTAKQNDIILSVR